MADTGSSVESLSALELEGLEKDGEIEEVWVTITGIHAKRDGKWQKLGDVSKEQQRINLMDLHFQPELLGEGRLPAGTYTEFRFQVEANDEDNGILNNFIVVDGEEVPLKIPSNEIKPHINMDIAEGAVVQLVFDVDHEQFVDRSKGSITNPRKMLKFVGLLEKHYGSITGKIELPEGVSDILSIDVRLLRTGMDEPVWVASLEENVVTFKVDHLLAGEYKLEATLKFSDKVEITLYSPRFFIEVGLEKEIIIGEVSF